MNDAFSISHIDDAIFKRINGRSYKKNCPLPLTELRYLRLLHKNLSGEVLSGEMICNRAIADALIDIFSRLFDASYPIERMILIDDYDADDELSMRDNNSSCFNFRFVSHTNRISKHGYGLAVDINPLYNPYITFVDGKKNIEPATAVAFEDRSGDFPYKIVEGDLCCRLFAEHGFGWGGDWIDGKDYQHFFVLGG
ncbi:MAG: M15 family metallopeptidase [Selenomonadaceae bacterium]|nr:M15 family metallopeptidase [Selenomonadaceae bacterium]